MKFIFCESWCPSRVWFESTFIYHGNGVLTEDVKDSSLIELLYADDLVLCGERLDEVIDKYGRWKNAVEGRV